MSAINWSHAAVIAGIALACYTNTLRGDFVFDDHRGIETNDDIRADKTTLAQLFQNDFWGGSMTREQSHKSYRPLTVLSYRWLNYALFGMAAWWFHAVNALLHAAASVLCWLVVVCQLRLSSRVSLWTGVLFAVHSLHTEAVANTVGRAEVLAAIFFFAGMLAYVRVTREGAVTRWPHFSVAVLFGVLSLLSKEQGITVLLVYAAMDILRHYGDATLRKATAVRVLVLAVCAIVVLRLRLAMNHGTQPIFKPEEMRAAFHAERSVRLLSFQYIYAWNALLLLWPAPLCCDWSLGSLPLVESLSDWRNAASCLLYAGLLAFGLAALRDLLKSSYRPALAFAMLLLPFLPSTGALVRVGFVVAERVLYIPSAGWCAMVALGYERLVSASSPLSPPVRRAVHGAAVLTLLAMAAKTVHRSEEWNSDLQLYQSGVKVNPNNVKLHNNYGMMLVDLGRRDDAHAAYQSALRLEPLYHDVHFNLGNLYHSAGQLEKAAGEFEYAAENPNQARRSLNNLGSVLMKLNRLPEAEKALRLAAASPAPGNQDNAQAYNNLASVLGEMKKYGQAEEAFLQALAIRPDYIDAHFNLGTLLVHAGRLDEAEKRLKQALQINRHHAGALNNLKVVEWRRSHPGQ